MRVRILIWLALLLTGGNEPLLCTQAVTDGKAADGCKPCRSLEKLVPRTKLSPVNECSLKEVEKFLQDANACMETAPTSSEENTEKDKQYCDVQLMSVRDLVSELEKVKSAIESAQHKQEQLSPVLRSLEGLPGLPGSRRDLPPQEVCQHCDNLWNAMAAIVAFSKAGQPFGVKNVDNGNAAAKVADLYRQASQKLCEPRRVILSLSVNAGELDYYTWTPTWEAYQKIRQALETTAFYEFCQ